MIIFNYTLRVLKLIVVSLKNMK